MGIGNRVLAQSDAMGALPILYAATQELPGASYTGPGGFQEHARATRRPRAAAPAAADKEVAKRLWDVSEQLTGVSFPLVGAAA